MILKYDLQYIGKHWQKSNLQSNLLVDWGMYDVRDSMNNFV